MSKTRIYQLVDLVGMSTGLLWQKKESARWLRELTLDALELCGVPGPQKFFFLLLGASGA